MERAFKRLKADAERVDLPNECEENDRAVRFLALETGVGHYDDLNLLILAALIIFISVSFLAVNGGKINDDEEFGFSAESFMSGEFTAGLEERYIAALPMPEEIKKAEEWVSLLYGFGNTVSEDGRNKFNSGGTNDHPDAGYNLFDPDDDNGLEENVFTTKPVQTDKDGNVIPDDDDAVTAPGGGTTAFANPGSTFSTTTTYDDEEEENTTTNNDAPIVTTTTTVVTGRTETSESTDIDDSSIGTEPSETEPSQTEPSETESSQTEPSETEPPIEDEPAE